MHKIMTRTQRRPGTRPPGRRDPRRPGGYPPRTPGGTLPRTADDNPPPRNNPTPPADRPRDTRPPSTPLVGAAAGTAPGRTAGVAGARRVAAYRSEPGGHTGAAGAAGVRTDGVARAANIGAVRAQDAVRAASLPVATDLFADRLLAVLSGQRPVHWMLRHTAGRAYDELAWLAERGALRTRGARPVVCDIGYYEPRPGAVEAFARIGAGDQLRAMAFRLEQGRDRRWRCTAVELGGPRMPHLDDDLP
ncbi:Rv3235 family protein [Streptomyces sp. NPDC052043]|uniref:Rv3235 family protein n=1 Tax=Streptomyces sp. NPDC052043 TaxID=3365684 RepID=UPI0037CF2F3B